MYSFPIHHLYLLTNIMTENKTRPLNTESTSGAAPEEPRVQSLGSRGTTVVIHDKPNKQSRRRDREQHRRHRGRNREKNRADIPSTSETGRVIGSHNTFR